jgi:hypothetical protein
MNSSNLDLNAVRRGWGKHALFVNASKERKETVIGNENNPEYNFA